MNTDEKILHALDTLQQGQQQLEKRLAHQGKALEAMNNRLDTLEQGQQGLKQDIERVELKVEVVNSNLQKAKADIQEQIESIFAVGAAQSQITKLEERVKRLEDKPQTTP